MSVTYNQNRRAQQYQQHQTNKRNYHPHQHQQAMMRPGQTSMQNQNLPCYWNGQEYVWEDVETSQTATDAFSRMSLGGTSTSSTLTGSSDSQLSVKATTFKLPNNKFNEDYFARVATTGAMSYRCPRCGEVQGDQLMVGCYSCYLMS